MLGEMILGGEGPLGYGPDASPPAAGTVQTSAFISSEAIDAAALTALTEEATLPVENLQTMRPDEVYRTTASVDQYIDIVLAQPLALDSVAIVQDRLASFTDGGTWRFIGAANQTNIPLSPDVDTGTKSVWPVTGKPVTKEAYLMSFMLFTNAMPCMYWRLYVSDPSASYIELSRLLAAVSFRPDANIDLTPAWTRNSSNYVAWTEHGQVYTDNRGPNRRQWTVPFSSLKHDEMMGELDELELYCGTDRDFVVCLDPGATTYRHKYTMQAMFAQNSQRAAQPLWDGDVQLWQTQIIMNEVT